MVSTSICLVLLAYMGFRVWHLQLAGGLAQRICFCCSYFGRLSRPLRQIVPSYSQLWQLMHGIMTLSSHCSAGRGELPAMSDYA
jgi:hypothetical protein